MKFKIDFDIKPLSEKINYEGTIFLIGSCFAENIGNKLSERKFTIYENPNGILFNPISIFNAIENIIEGKVVDETDLVLSNEVWYSFHHHSQIKSESKEELINTIKDENAKALMFLKQSKWLVITMGSAWVYQLSSNQKIVANCHKMPQQLFTKRLLDVNEIVNAFDKMYNKIKGINPDINLLLTVSPVKYLRDGVIENNLSKSSLLLASNTIKQKHIISYFPAYEIVNDELRDYRFYEADLAHPNDLAVDYIWQRFIETCMNDKTKTTLAQVEEIRKAYIHKPFNSNTNQHNVFLKTFFDKATQLQAENPNMDLKKEITYFSV